MGFSKKDSIISDDAMLIDIADLDENGEPVEVAVASFSDGDTLNFPKGCRFPVDNYHGKDGDVQLRLRATMPPVDGKFQPTVLIPQYCTKTYVKDCIKRLQKGV